MDFFGISKTRAHSGMAVIHFVSWKLHKLHRLFCGCIWLYPEASFCFLDPESQGLSIPNDAAGYVQLSTAVSQLHSGCPELNDILVLSSFRHIDIMSFIVCILLIYSCTLIANLLIWIPTFLTSPIWPPAGLRSHTVSPHSHAWNPKLHAVYRIQSVCFIWFMGSYICWPEITKLS